LIFEEEVVHLPELAVGGGELGGFCGVFGVRVHLEREVTEDEAELVAEVLLQLFYDGVRVAAGWTLVVSVLDEGPWGVGLALRVVVAGGRRGEFAHGYWMPWIVGCDFLFACGPLDRAEVCVYIFAKKYRQKRNLVWRPGTKRLLCVVYACWRKNIHKLLGYEAVARRVRNEDRLVEWSRRSRSVGLFYAMELLQLTKREEEEDA